MAAQTEQFALNNVPGFADALDCDVRASRRFEGLTPSQKLRYMEPISTARQSEIRERRIVSALAALRRGP